MGPITFCERKKSENALATNSQTKQSFCDYVVTMLCQELLLGICWEYVVNRLCGDFVKVPDTTYSQRIHNIFTTTIPDTTYPQHIHNIFTTYSQTNDCLVCEFVVSLL